jgi:hypothetical protein
VCYGSSNRTSADDCSHGTLAARQVRNPQGPRSICVLSMRTLTLLLLFAHDRWHGRGTPAANAAPAGQEVLNSSLVAASVFQLEQRISAEFCAQNRARSFNVGSPQASMCIIQHQATFDYEWNSRGSGLLRHHDLVNRIVAGSRRASWGLARQLRLSG